MAAIKPPASNYIELTVVLTLRRARYAVSGGVATAKRYFGGIRSVTGGRNRSVYTVAGSGLTGS